MLFSSPEVADFINKNFEPTWISVRPVPKVTIDFGNGRKMTRTVNGNIATYVCTKDGVVVDVVPGIYTKENYISALQSIRKQFDILPSEPIALEQSLKLYHSSAQTIPRDAMNAARDIATAPMVVQPKNPYFNETVELKKALLADTNVNETQRRPMIHAYLVEHGRSTPDDMKKWLYREVLHADLDDPYLGFDRVLTQSYPFDDPGS